MQNTINTVITPLKTGQREQTLDKHADESKQLLIRLFSFNLSEEKVSSWLPYFLFLGALGILYITNTHYAEKNVYAINKLKKELKEQRWEYMVNKADLMYKSKQTEVATKAAILGLKEAAGPPEKIIIIK